MENKEITIIDLVKIAGRWIWLLVASAIVCSSVVFFYSKNFIVPVYSANSQFLIQTKDQGNDNDVLDSQRKIAYAQLVVGTYIDILDTRNFAEEISYYMNGYIRWGEDSDEKIASFIELGLGNAKPYNGRSEEYTADEIKRMISYTTTEESTTFSAKVESGDYKESYTICRCIEIAISDYIDKKYPGVGVVAIIDRAVENPNPINNNTFIYTLIGFIGGFVLAFAAVYILEMADNRIKSEKELAAKTGLSIVGIIPDSQYEKSSTTVFNKKKK